MTISYNLPTLPLAHDLETKAVLKKLAKAHAALAELNGITQLIPNPSIIINALTLQEAKDSSAIENIITTHDELYKADMQIGKLNTATKEVQDYRRALMTGYSYVTKSRTLLVKHICDIQEILEHNSAGIRKISGTELRNENTNETVYIPPQTHNVIVEHLTNLEHYINSSDEVDPLIKLAVIHHQFESIHPFYDGNGRTGRIINVLYLILSSLLDHPILYLSGYIMQHKSEYYKLLQQTRDTYNREPRILYILDAIEKTSKSTTDMIRQIWDLMGEAKHLMKQNTTFYHK
jgi:Fic family protein